MGQAGLLHDGVEPDAVEPILPEQAREAVATIRARFSAAFSRVTRIVVRSFNRHSAPPGHTVKIWRGASWSAPALYRPNPLLRSPPRAGQWLRPA